jgi:hypothetical protein
MLVAKVWELSEEIDNPRRDSGIEGGGGFVEE